MAAVSATRLTSRTPARSSSPDVSGGSGAASGVPPCEREECCVWQSLSAMRAGALRQTHLLSCSLPLGCSCCPGQRLLLLLSRALLQGEPGHVPARVGRSLHGRLRQHAQPPCRPGAPVAVGPAAAARRRAAGRSRAREARADAALPISAGQASNFDVIARARAAQVYRPLEFLFAVAAFTTLAENFLPQLIALPKARPGGRGARCSGRVDAACPAVLRVSAGSAASARRPPRCCRWRQAASRLACKRSGCSCGGGSY